MPDYVVRPQADVDADPTDTSNATLYIGVADGADITGLTNGTALHVQEVVLGAGVTATPEAVGAVPTAWNASLTLPGGDTSGVNVFRSSSADLDAYTYDRSTDSADNALLALAASPSADTGSVVVSPAGAGEGILEITAPASGSQTVTYGLIDSTGGTATGTLTITAEADNGYTPSTILADGDDWIDASGGVDSADSTEMTLVFAAKLLDRAGAATVFALYDGSDVALLDLMHQGWNYRALGSLFPDLQENNGHVGRGTITNGSGAGFAHEAVLVLTVDATGNAELWLHRRDSGWWMMASASTGSAITLPLNSAARHTVFNTTAGAGSSEIYQGNVHRLVAYPAALDMSVQANRELIVTPGGQLVDPTTLDGTLGTPCAGCNFRTPADYTGATGSNGTFA